MKDVKGREVCPGQKVRVREFKSAKWGALQAFSGLVLAVHDEVETVDVVELHTFNRRTVLAERVSVTASVDKVEECRREVAEDTIRELTGLHRHFAAAAGFRHITLPARRGYRKVEKKDGGSKR